MKTLDKVLIDRAQTLRQDVQRRDSGEKLLTHVPTGFSVIDDSYGGIRRGVATELMAHTGDGKSAFAKQVCEATAKAGGACIWYCGEDPEDATAERHFADGTSVSATEIGRLDVSQATLNKIDAYVETASSWAKRIAIIFDTATVEEVLRTVNQATTIGGSPFLLLVLDYLQIFGDEGSLEQEIARMTTGLNNLAGSRRIATLLLSQVSNHVILRGTEQWNKHKTIAGFIPKLGDTEWCRRAEKSVKVAASLFRPGRWLRQMGEEAEDNTAEVHIFKGNFGPTGWETLGWDGPQTKFYNLDRA